jgi:hypothetical protein
MINLSCSQISLAILTPESLSLHECEETELKKDFRRRTEGTQTLKTRRVGSFRLQNAGAAHKSTAVQGLVMQTLQ